MASALAQLGELLGDRGDPARTPHRALPADGARNVFERALIALGEADPTLAATRREELAYLANVWIAGGSHDGRRPRPIEALEFVVRVCNRGIEAACRDGASSSSPTPPELGAAVQVLASTSADRLLRLGYVRPGARAGEGERKA
jgi:hypothetical protein